MYSQKDSRLEKVEEITINFSTFKKALKRNYLEGTNHHDRSFVLRLYPPFEAEMKAEYYESMQGRHYDNNWEEKPFHIRPELLILEGNNGSFRNIVNYPEEWQVRQALSKEEIEEEGGIEESMAIGEEMFWDELKTILPSEFDLGVVSGFSNYPVNINWEFPEE
jgi:hypothetical protein